MQRSLKIRAGLSSLVMLAAVTPSWATESPATSVDTESIRQVCHQIGELDDRPLAANDLLAVPTDVPTSHDGIISLVERVCAVPHHANSSLQLAGLVPSSPELCWTKQGVLLLLILHDKTQQRVLATENGGQPFWIDQSLLGTMCQGGSVTFDGKAARGPRLAALTYTFDLGAFHGTTKEKRRIVFVNTGSESLEAKLAAFSCSCASAQFEPASASPGGYTELLIDMDSSRKGIGQFSLKGLIQSNEPSVNEHTISLKATVTPGIVFEPSYFSFGDIPPTVLGKDLVSQLALTEVSNIVVKTVYEDPGITPTGVEKDLIKGNNVVKHHLDLSAVAVDDEGRFRVQAILETNSADFPGLQMGVVGRRLPWIEIMPRKILIGPAKGGSSISRTVHFVSYAFGDPETTVADADVLTAHPKDKELDLQIRVPEAPGYSSTTATLKIGGQQANVEVSILSQGT